MAQSPYYISIHPLRITLIEKIYFWANFSQLSPNKNLTSISWKSLKVSIRESAAACLNDVHFFFSIQSFKAYVVLSTCRWWRRAKSELFNKQWSRMVRHPNHTSTKLLSFFIGAKSTVNAMIFHEPQVKLMIALAWENVFSPGEE